MSFYRIYRPKVLEEIDNASVRSTVELLLTKPKNQLPHAYLLIGPKGTGKTTTARVIAKLFNCEKPEKNGSPCGSCNQCKAIADGRHLDVMEIDAASNTGVDNIRDLRDRVALAPAQAKWKIYIIDEVHMLSTGAFNALLKTLEEPPLHAIFILATTDPQKIPATVVSRCQLISFGKAHTDDLIHALKRIVKTEKMTIDEDALSLIAQYADGSFRDAVKSLEQVSFKKGKVTVDNVQKTLAITGDKRRDNFLSHLLRRDATASLTDIQTLVGEGADIKSFLIDCLKKLEQQLVVQATPELRGLIKILMQAYAELRTSPIPELPLELAVVEYSGNTVAPPVPPHEPLGLITVEKLDRHWRDVIDEMKPFNHSIAGVMRSTRPKMVKGDIVTIEAFYPFHQEKLSEVKTRDAIATVLKKLFGEKVKVEVTLGKK
ncbi:MAG: polymerase III gamma and tau subunit protein [Microgenomates group bacterium GW2011_GWA2_47_8]|nr:MAG: polymerase III gamma and tau subunit protein [Microgenomates group bacterium GW2011_GWA2_47_8]